MHVASFFTLVLVVTLSNGPLACFAVINSTNTNCWRSILGANASVAAQKAKVLLIGT